MKATSSYGYKPKPQLPTGFRLPKDKYKAWTVYWEYYYRESTTKAIKDKQNLLRFDTSIDGTTFHPTGIPSVDYLRNYRTGQHRRLMDEYYGPARRKAGRINWERDLRWATKKQEEYWDRIQSQWPNQVKYRHSYSLDPDESPQIQYSLTRDTTSNSWNYTFTVKNVSFTQYVAIGDVSLFLFCLKSVFPCNHIELFIDLGLVTVS